MIHISSDSTTVATTDVNTTTVTTTPTTVVTSKCFKRNAKV